VPDVLMEYKGQRKRVKASDVDTITKAGGRVVEEAAMPAQAPAPQLAGESDAEAPGLLDRIRAGAEEFGQRMQPEAQAMRTGTAKGLTLGLDDVAAGAGAFLGDVMARQQASDEAMLSGGGESLADSIRAAGVAFHQGQQERRAETEVIKEKAPESFSAGEILGTLLVPVSSVKGAAAAGAAGGVGFSDADTLEDAAASAALGGAVGGLVGKAAPKAVEGLRAAGAKAGNFARDVAQKGLERVGSRADELRVLTTMGATGGTISNPQILKEVANVPGGVSALANTLRETGVSKGITTTGRIAEKAAALEQRAGAEIGRLVDDATTAGGFVEVGAITARLRDQAAKAVSGGKGISAVQQKEANALLRLAGKLDDMFPGGVGPVREVKDASVALAQDAQAAYRARIAGRDVEGQGRALMEARRATEGGVDEAIAGLGMEPTAYQTAKTQFQAGRLAREAADVSLGRANKNNLLGLTDVGLMASTGPVGVIARKFASPIAASARATTAEFAQAVAQRLVQSKPLSSAAGPWAKKVAEASGNPSLLMRVVGDMMKDPKAEAALRADVAKETIAAAPKEQRRELAATALSALGGPQFSAADFAKNYAQARTQGGPYAAIIKEVGRPGDEFLTSLYGASKKAKNDAVFAGVLAAMGDGTLSGALKSDATLLSKAAAAMRDPAMVRLSGGKPSRGAVKAAANSKALRDFLRAAKMPSKPADAEAWLQEVTNGR
jgi:hypothetical protein